MGNFGSDEKFLRVCNDQLKKHFSNLKCISATEGSVDVTCLVAEQDRSNIEQLKERTLEIISKLTNEDILNGYITSNF